MCRPLGPAGPCQVAGVLCAEVGVAGVASQTEPLGSSSPMPPHSGRWVGRSSWCPRVGSNLGGGDRRCQDLWAWRTAKPSGSVGLVGHRAGGEAGGQTPSPQPLKTHLAPVGAWCHECQPGSLLSLHTRALHGHCATHRSLGTRLWKTPCRARCLLSSLAGHHPRRCPVAPSVSSLL